MSRSQLEKLSIADVPSGAGAFDYYNTFSVVQEGSDEASRQVLSIERGTAPVIEDGQTIVMTKNYDLTVSGLFKQSTISGLQSLADNRTDVVFGGFGLGGQILQMDGKVNLGQVLGETASFRFNSPREATGGYDSSTGKHTSGINYCTNGLAQYKWQEGSTSGEAAGWTIDGDDKTVSFANSIQVLDSGSNTLTMTRDLYLPFDGRAIYFNIKTNAGDAPTGTVTIQLISYTDNGTSPDATGSAVSVTAADTAYQATVSPSSSAKMVRAIISLASGADLEFKEPTIQLDSTYNFVEFNT
tara:strand:- start:106 stop:1002 length:897 start_codon:yes stop_codon:yes gene_type:complete